MSDQYISAKDERARIVAWLKQEPHLRTWKSGLAFAEAIERGEHWEERCPPHNVEPEPIIPSRGEGGAGGDKTRVTDQYGYPLDWPKCPGCGLPALDGHITCGKVECDEGGRR